MLGGVGRTPLLDGRVAVVTGASSGIGAALARALARRGAAVALVARRAGRLRELAEEIDAAGGRASVHPGDVADRAVVERSAGEILHHHGRVDGLVNAAGFVHHGLVKDHPPAEVARLVQVNVLGSLHWTQAVLPSVRAQPGSWIVNVSSFAGLVPQPDEAVYSATKAAITAFSAALGSELAPLGVHVLAVHPVLVSTEMFTPEVLARMPAGSEKRFISAEAFAEETLSALARRERSVVIPRRYRWVVRLRALAPERFDRIVARTRLAALPDVTR
jgi:short-subunit dehydrogenase